MKKIYFVRHGESETNAGMISKGAMSRLTEKGVEQAYSIAERCAKLPVDVIVSSTIPRAMETAEIINSKISKPIEYSNFFVERRRPSEQTGITRSDSKYLAIDETILENFSKTGYRYSDEENFEDLKKRADEAFEYLENRPEENILVLTHGFFMRIVLARAIFGKSLSAYEAEKFFKTMHMANTGLSIFGYDENNQGTPWHVWVWSDHAHLG